MNILRTADEIKVGKEKDGATVSLLLLKIVYCQQSEVDVATFNEIFGFGDLKKSDTRSNQAISCCI